MDNLTLWFRCLDGFVENTPYIRLRVERAVYALYAKPGNWGTAYNSDGTVKAMYAVGDRSFTVTPASKVRDYYTIKMTGDWSHREIIALSYVMESVFENYAHVIRLGFDGVIISDDLSVQSMCDWLNIDEEEYLTVWYEEVEPALGRLDKYAT